MKRPETTLYTLYADVVLKSYVLPWYSLKSAPKSAPFLFLQPARRVASKATITLYNNGAITHTDFFD
ncbi:hypothetical protein [Methyloglobulus sp.]|uniref:hypothetical protein n=1 Tax=Methyloglobulus sp. TaxID=2518622 RepID=UPI0032B87F5B